MNKHLTKEAEIIIAERIIKEMEEKIKSLKNNMTVPRRGKWNPETGLFNTQYTVKWKPATREEYERATGITK